MFRLFLLDNVYANIWKTLLKTTVFARSVLLPWIKKGVPDVFADTPSRLCLVGNRPVPEAVSPRSRHLRGFVSIGHYGYFVDNVRSALQLLGQLFSLIFILLRLFGLLKYELEREYQFDIDLFAVGIASGFHAAPDSLPS